MSGEVYTFTSELWRWAARTDSWFFLTVPEDQSDEISAIPRPPRGFGGVRVEVTVGRTTWRTSIFPGTDAYVLPIKRAVLNAEGIEQGDLVDARIELV